MSDAEVEGKNTKKSEISNNLLQFFRATCMSEISIQQVDKIRIFLNSTTLWCLLCCYISDVTIQKRLNAKENIFQTHDHCKQISKSDV